MRGFFISRTHFRDRVSGYSLPELMIAASIGSFVAMGAYSIFQYQRRAEWTQDTREALNFERESIATLARRRLAPLLQQPPTVSSGLFTFGPNAGSNSKITILIACESTSGDALLKSFKKSDGTGLAESTSSSLVSNSQCVSCSGNTRARVTVNAYDENSNVVSTKKFPVWNVGDFSAVGKYRGSVATNVCFSTATCAGDQCKMSAEIIQTYLKTSVSSGASFKASDALAVDREMITISSPEQLGSSITILPALSGSSGGSSGSSGGP